MGSAIPASRAVHTLCVTDVNRRPKLVVETDRAPASTARFCSSGNPTGNSIDCAALPADSPGLVWSCISLMAGTYEIFRRRCDVYCATSDAFGTDGRQQ
jgi:hypothetical protein